MSGTARKSVGKLRPGAVKSLAKASYQGSLPAPSFAPPPFAPPTPHLTFSERQAVQQRALGSDGSWQTVGGHPKGNSFSSGAGRGLLAEPEAILGFHAGQGVRLISSAEWTSPVESVLNEEVSPGVGHSLW